MRRGYAIRNRPARMWLQTRVRNDKGTLTRWTVEEDEAMVFRRLDDAKRMLRLLQSEVKRPERLQVLDPRWRVIVQ